MKELIPFTDRQIKDLINCRDDVRHFAEIHCRMSNPALLQAFALNEIEGARFPVMVIEEDVADELAAVFILWVAMFSYDKTIMIVGKTITHSQGIIDKIKTIYETIPDHLRVHPTEYNKRSLTFDNGVQVIARARTSNAARGMCLSFVYCSGADPKFDANMEPFWEAITPQMAVGFTKFLISTTHDPLVVSPFVDGGEDFAVIRTLKS